MNVSNAVATFRNNQLRAIGIIISVINYNGSAAISVKATKIWGILLLPSSAKSITRPRLPTGGLKISLYVDNKTTVEIMQVQ